MIGPSGWPGLALSYALAPSPAELRLTLGFQQHRYVPSPTVPAGEAVEAVAADLVRLRELDADLAQPGVAFALKTTLAVGDQGELPAAPIAAFVRSAYLHLAARSTLGAATLDITADAPQTIASALAELGVTGAALFAANADALYASLFGTSALTVPVATPVAPADGQTLADHARANGVTLEQLGDANAASATAFAPGARIAIPGALRTYGATSWPTYAAGASDRLQDLAARFDVGPADIAHLNSDVPGLLVSGQAIVEPASGAAVVTEAGDTFEALVARFDALRPAVTLTVAQLADLVAGQTGLLVEHGLWIAPALRSDVGGRNPERTVGALAEAHGTDLGALAAANAATIGFLAPGIAVGGLTTTAHDTLSTLVTRGLAATVADVAELVADVPGLVAEDALVVPGAPDALGVVRAIVPRTAAPLFRVATTLVVTGGAGDVSRSEVPPQSFDEVVAALQAAVPGLHAAFGEDDDTMWALNLGATCGPAASWTFAPEKTTSFALPPLSRTLVSGAVDVPEYVSGRRPPYATSSLAFEGVDLDAWLDELAAAVDVVLSPACAAQDVAAVVEAKRVLAEALSRRVEHVFADDDGGSPGEAQAALRDALVERLGAVTTAGTVVQVPAAVTWPPAADGAPAPRLVGTLTAATDADDDAGPFTFSTEPLPLTAPAHVTFLLRAASPTAQREAELDLRYVVTGIEVPGGDDLAPSRLQLVDPLAPAALPGVRVPVPLRTAPSTVALVAQEAVQTVPAPASAAELRLWDFAFTLQHDSAAQDTTFAEVTFDAAPVGLPPADPPPGTVFEALARFVAVWPALHDDLTTPGAEADAAAEAFAQLARGVADAFAAAQAPLPGPTAEEDVPPEAPPTCRADGLDVFGHPAALGRASIARNLVLTPGRTTAPGFVRRTPIVAFPQAATPTIVATAPIELAGSGIADALGTFFAELLAAAPGPLPIRLAGNAVAPGDVTTTTPVFLVAAYDFDPATDAEPDGTSFVSNVERTVLAWAADAEPPAPAASYDFDLTVFAGDDPPRPVIHATTLRFVPRETG